MQRALNGITVLVRGMRVMIGMSNEDEQDTSILTAALNLTIDISEFFTLVTDRIWDSCLFQSAHKTAAFMTWVTTPLRRVLLGESVLDRVSGSI